MKTIGLGERARVVPGWREGATLEIEVTTQDGVKVVKLKGRMSIGPTLDRFDKTVSELLKQGQKKIVLDVEEVPQIDSSGIGMLVRHLVTAKKEGGAISLLKPSKFAMHTLKMVGLLNLFSTYEDLPQAIASFQLQERPSAAKAALQGKQIRLKPCPPELWQATCCQS
jgi:anti-anti-sigma factor